MEETETKRTIEQETEKACDSGERSIPKRRKAVSNKRSYKHNERKAEEETCSKSCKKKDSRGWVHCEEEEEEDKGKRIRRRKSKRQQKDDKVVVDEALRLQRRTRYLLIKMKMQQNLIDAYATEGWKGQSREKIRPDKELQRAREQILNCKLGLRDAVRQLDLLSLVGRMEEQVMATDGSIHHDNIFCAECNSREAFPDNDIILCDGTCCRAFHQKCLDPPLETENIPPGDQGWFCKFCDCKMEIIDTMNAQIGTHFSVDSNWEDIFKEEASLPIGSEATLNNEADWPSDDSKDDDYDPEMRETGGGNSGNVSGGDCDGDGDGDGDGEGDSSSLSLASDGVALSTGSWEGHEFNKMVELCETSNEEAVSGPRQRRTVDYTKLYYEMFGKDAGLQEEQGSEDEDWGPNDRRKRRKESDDAASTLVTMCENSKKDDIVEIPKQSERDSVSVGDKGGRRPMFRIPRAAVERLRQVFAENELPSKAVRDSLSRELSLDPEKVSKWFKNTRYMALRNRKTESVKQPENSKAVSGDSGPEPVMENNEETNEIQDTLDENNDETNEIQDTLDENNDETNEIQDTLDENNEETNEVEVTMDENIEETNEVEVTMDENIEETNEIQDTLDETVPLRHSAANQKTNQEEIQEAANASFPTPTAESPQYLEQKDSSFTQMANEELSSEMSLQTAIEEKKETESKMTEEEEIEAMMEMVCRAENKLMDVTQRVERFKTPKGRKRPGKFSSCVVEQESVVYVPTAEIRENKL